MKYLVLVALFILVMSCNNKPQYNESDFAKTDSSSRIDTLQK
jgi:hypothetical protein